jgi:hypothetical protein
VEAGLAKEKQPQKEQIKVTDKRIFTADGEIREEFREQIKPADPDARPIEKPAPAAPEPKKTEQKPEPADRRGTGGERRRSLADQAANPGTPFADFLEPLIAQAFMSLGMLPNPYQPQTKPDIGAARQMIDILSLLQEKTAGNLKPEEEEFLNAYLGELKLNYVKITKNLP